MQENTRVLQIAFVGDHLRRKCGIATFTSDLLAAVANAHPQNQCFSAAQHAVFNVPNLSKRYCTDDNSRAFILAILLGELGEEPEQARVLATTCATFLHHAFDTNTKRFDNHMMSRQHLETSEW